MVRPARGALQRGQQGFGWVEIREALGEVQGPVLVGQAGHPSDDGFRETFKAAGGSGHGGEAPLA